jgi:hypothetical protein
MPYNPLPSDLQAGRVAQVASKAIDNLYSHMPHNGARIKKVTISVRETGAYHVDNKRRYHARATATIQVEGFAEVESEQ